ncbi:MAG: response regulator [Verrucomicrobiales bacterium]
MPYRKVEILLVEDNPFDLELALRSLRKHHVSNTIHVARDGEEALDFLFCRGEYSDRSYLQQPKLVLLDLKLPKVSGLEVLKEMKSDPRTKMIPVVVLTSSKEQEDVLQGYALGTNSFLQKPVKFEDFDELVHKLGCYWVKINETPNLLLVEGEEGGSTDDASSPGSQRAA